MEEPEMKQKYLQLQMAAEQMKGMHAQLQVVEAKTREIEDSIQSLQDVKGMKTARMLAPIVEGVFLPAELKSSTEVIVNVGAGVCVKKSIDEAKALLEDKFKEMGQYAKEIHAGLEQAAEAVKGIEKELTGALTDKNV